ncbi:unnamed protein product [Oppiella nova]|uniref:Transmembrane protein 177 n=1 Tax=Oppiella nova TaxID=334625 RepID=A0A7R9LMN7_9ACAR|nr:unnamed protein product [Oppiella nova]CAG2165164.1 unnamed protein product [Oppiella nova]
MAKLLVNSLREVRNGMTALHNSYNAWRFGLQLMSEKRYNYYYRLILLSGSCLTTGLYFTYNTLLIDHYKAIVHSYSSGDLSPLNDELKTFATNVWTECQRNLHHKSSDLVHFFPSVGSEPIYIGTLGLPTGATIGLPFLLNYHTVDDVKTIDLRFKGEQNPYTKWRSEAGQAFIKSLVLSPNAKKYAIAQRIHSANNVNLFADCLNITVSTAVALGLAQELINRVKSLKTFGQRFVVRSVSLIIGYCLWSTFNQTINYWSSLRADKRTVSLGDDYLEGAVEYYRKLKTRNAAFYRLTEDDSGWKVFTADGEDRGLLSARLLTISRRLNYLNQLKDETRGIDEVDIKSETK